MDRTPLRIVSALLMSLILTVPVLGAVCSTLCGPSAGVRAHRAHSAGAHHTVAEGQLGEHHHAGSASVNLPVAHHHHAAPPPVADAPQSSAAWNGRCCDRPTLTLAAVLVVRHELQIAPAVFNSASVLLGGSDVRPADLSRDAARAPSLPSQTNPVLRV